MGHEPSNYRRPLLGVVTLVTAIALLGPPGTAFADHEAPTDVSGSVTTVPADAVVTLEATDVGNSVDPVRPERDACAQAGSTAPESAKAENPAVGTHTLAPGVVATVSEVVAGDPTAGYTVSITGADLTEVILKAGSVVGHDDNVYRFSPAVTSATPLMTPRNSAGNIAELSHIIFCYDPTPSVSVTKTASASVVSAEGDDVTFTVIVMNTGPVNVTITALTDSVYGNLLDDCPGLSGLTLTPGASAPACQFTAFVDPGVANPHVNTVTATATDPGGETTTGQGTSTVNFNVVPVVTVTKTPSEDVVPSGSRNVTFTVTVLSNETVTLESLIDDVYLNLHTAGGQGTDCIADGSVTIQAGVPYVCEFTRTVEPDHENTVTATVSDGVDEVDASDSAQVDVNVPPSVTVAKTAAPDEVPEAGGDVTFTVQVTNAGQATVVLQELTDDVFGDLDDVGSCQTGVEIAPEQTITCSFTEAVEPGHENTVTAVVIDSFEDTATDSASASVGLLPPNPPPPPGPGPGGVPSASADLSVGKAVDDATLAVGDSASFTITVTNNGPNIATAVSLTDTVPDGLDITDVTTSRGTCSVNGQQVNCALGSLAVGATAVVTVEVEATEAGEFTNVAVASSPTGDPVQGNNTNDADVEVTDLGVAGDCVTIIDGLEGFEGPTRIETAVEASQAVFCDGAAGAVVLTRSDLFPDAQAGTPLAIAKNAPLLLSETTSLNPNTEEEILRVLQPGGTVYLLGGDAALSQDVEDRLIEIGYQTTRYGGLNRFGTAAIIADLGLGNPDMLLAANGGDFPDSVMAGAATLAAGLGSLSAVILTSDSNVPPETAAYLATRTDNPTVIAIGGPAAAAFPGVESIVGASRFDTSVAVAERFFDNPTVAGLATGLNFADALTGGSVIGRNDIGPGPMLLTDPLQLPQVVADYIDANASTITGIAIFGGEAAISNTVRDQVADLLS